LHRLTDAVLDQLERPGLTLVLLVPDPAEERWSVRRGPVLRMDSSAGEIRQALLASRPGLRAVARPRPSPEPIALKTADAPHARTGRIIAVTGGAGSPGRTTVAIDLALALSTREPPALVEAALGAPAGPASRHR